MRGVTAEDAIGRIPIPQIGRRGLEKEATFFVVVCTDLHTCIGPFQSFEGAIQASALLTRASKEIGANCTFVPVPFQTNALVVNDTAFPSVPKKDEKPYEPGGYI